VSQFAEVLLRLADNAAADFTQGSPKTKNLRQGIAGGFGGFALSRLESPRRLNRPAMLGQLEEFDTLENYMSKSCFFE
jgi:hypothetical protein